MHTYRALFLFFCTHLVAAEDVSIRMLLNNGREFNTGGKCNEREQEIVRQDLQVEQTGLIFSVDRRGLRIMGNNEEVNLALCSAVCSTFSAGTCWHLSTSCNNFQPSDEALAGDTIPITILSDRELAIPEMANVELSDFTPAEYLSCQKKRRNVLQNVERTVSSAQLSDNCKKTLQTKIDLACVKV